MSHKPFMTRTVNKVTLRWLQEHEVGQTHVCSETDGESALTD